MYIVFFSTSDVFEAEEKLIKRGVSCKIVPTPVTDKAYCGVCIETEGDECLNELSEMEFHVVD